VGVARRDYDANNSEECSVCFYELSAEHPTKPWIEHYGVGYSDDGLPEFLMEACTNHHVFHKVCLEETYIRAMNQRVDVECPFCKAPFKGQYGQALRMLEGRNKWPPDNNLDHPNPYGYTAAAYYEYERLRTQKKLRTMSSGLPEDLEDSAMTFFQNHAHDSESLADLFPVGDYVSLTEDEMEELKEEYLRNRFETKEVVVSLQTKYLSQSGPAKLETRQELSLYQTMMEYHNRILEALVTNQRFASLMEDEGYDSDSSFDSQAVPGTPPGDESDYSSDDGSAVPGTPASDRGGPSSGTMGDDSDEEDPTSPDNKRLRTFVPETPPQPSPPPRAPGSAPVVVPETPPHLLNPPSS
jgi:hypothetical protein